MNPRLAGRLGRAPEAAILASIGLVLVAYGNTLARSGGPIAGPLFWAGLLFIVVPISVRLLGGSATRRERLWLVSILGFALFMVKVLHDPLAFTFYDEILHLRTVDDIVLTGRLFTPNSILPPSPLYPGLEILTSILRTLTGVGDYEAGVVIVGASRLIVTVGLFLLYERLSGSARAAGIGVLVYAANPQFLYFNAQFSYETLGLALTVLVLELASSYALRSRRGLIATALVGIGVVVSHHLTAYVLTGLLAVWTVVAWLPGMRRGERRVPAVLFVVMTVFIGAWLLVVAAATIPYLAPRFGDALQFILLIIGQAQPRELFAGPPTGLAAPWERVLAYGSVLLVLGFLPLGLWRIWREFRTRPMVVTLGLLAATYPATLLLRLSERGAEESTRTPEFVFLGTGLVVGLVMTANWRPSLDRRLPRVARALHERASVATLGRIGQLATVGVFLVLFGGGVVIGVPAWARQPGPYLPSADMRSIESLGTGAAAWARDYLGQGNRFAADRINRILMGSEGRQEAVTSFRDGIPTWRLFVTPAVDAVDRQILVDGRIDYLVIDLRLPGDPPLTHAYFETGEPRNLAADGLLSPEWLLKWADEPGVNVVFDNGPIRIFDVRSLWGGG